MESLLFETSGESARSKNNVDFRGEVAGVIGDDRCVLIAISSSSKVGDKSHAISPEKSPRIALNKSKGRQSTPLEFVDEGDVVCVCDSDGDGDGEREFDEITEVGREKGRDETKASNGDKSSASAS